MYHAWFPGSQCWQEISPSVVDPSSVVVASPVVEDMQTEVPCYTHTENSKAENIEA